MNDSATAERLENHRTADAETEDCAEGGDMKDRISELEIIDDQRDGGKSNSQHVEPEWGLDIGQVAAKSHLQKQSRETDCSYDDQGKRTEKSATPGEDDDERKRKNEKAGGDDGPTASYRPRVGIGQWAISSLLCIPTL